MDNVERIVARLLEDGTRIVENNSMTNVD